MKNFETTIKPLVTFGEGTIKVTGEKFKQLGVTKVLAMFDAFLDPEIKKKIIKSVQDAGIELIETDPVRECTDEAVEAVIKDAEESKADGLLAVGGGVTMDTLKAASVLIGKEPPIHQYYAGWYEGPELQRNCKLVSIPTTAGTGAEATKSCIVHSHTLGVKASLISQACKSDVAILDPLVTQKLPPYPTATTGMDVIAHAAEALCCVKSNIYTEIICGKALELAYHNLPTAYKFPDDLDARAAMSLAAYFGLTGESYGNTGHSMAHAIGAEFGVAHGHCCAWTAPTALYFTKNDCDHEIRIIAKAFGLDPTVENVAENCANAIRKLGWSLDLKMPSEMGISREDFINCAPKVMLDPIHLANPTPLTEEKARELLAQVYDQVLY